MIVGLTPTVIIVRTAIHTIHYCRSTLASNPMISPDFPFDGELRGHFLTDSVPIKDFPASFPGGGIFFHLSAKIVFFPREKYKNGSPAIFVSFSLLLDNRPRDGKLSLDSPKISLLQ